MLQCEGKTLDEKSQVVPFVPDYLPLFWENVQLGDQTMYLNRLRETLSLEPPPPDAEHLGGSLNEAPGLGRTVECMALMLLNPDVRRNPSMKRWDADAKVYVREVRVSDDMISGLILRPFNLSSPS
jgi:E3 ubiquitin-protein ligase SHPRH